jgi:hypothetical protein
MYQHNVRGTKKTRAFCRFIYTTEPLAERFEVHCIPSGYISLRQRNVTGENRRHLGLFNAIGNASDMNTGRGDHQWGTTLYFHCCHSNCWTEGQSVILDLDFKSICYFKMLVKIRQKQPNTEISIWYHIGPTILSWVMIWILKEKPYKTCITEKSKNTGWKGTLGLHFKTWLKVICEVFIHIISASGGKRPVVSNSIKGGWSFLLSFS